ncbi:MAG: hypothetical protein ACI4WG_05735 [Erysipelotrichaceae bacterium]
MVVEILYPDICNFYGDRGNIIFLKENLSDSTIIETKVNDVPYFSNHEVDLIYLGSCSEAKQPMIIDRLKAYRDRLVQLINQDKLFLLTGNGLEIFAQNIYEDDKIVTTGLSILAVDVYRNYQKRINSLFKGKFQDLTIVGFQSQFDVYKSEMPPLFELKKGYKSFLNENSEGIRYKNLYATTVLGPILVLNPLFSQSILNLKELKYQDQLMLAYQNRLADFDRVLEKR